MRLLAIVAFCLFAVGCPSQSRIDPSIAATAQAKFQAKITSDPVGVRALRQWLAEGPQADVVITGTIGGMPNPFDKSLQPEFPWVPAESSVYLVDNAIAEKFKNHQHADPNHQCTFCERSARENADGVALIRFCEAEDVPFPHRADQLLGLREGQAVTIRGSAQQLGELMVVDVREIDLQ